jgi:hypothetical protein
MASFNRNQSNLILEILRKDQMIPQFYDSLNDKMEKMESSVRDIIKHLEQIYQKPLEFISPHNRRMCINHFLINHMEHSLAKGMRKLFRIYPFTDTEIELMLPDHYAKYDSFVVFGCPESTDIDIICFVRAEDCIFETGQTKELSDTSVRKIHSELRDLGYDVDRRKVDINIVYIDPIKHMIMASSNCPRETQNNVNATYMYHRQPVPSGLDLHPMVDIELTDDILLDKMRAFAKYIMDYSEDICPVYKTFRPIKTSIYSESGDRMMIFMREILKYISYAPADIIKYGLDMTKYHSRYKSIIMKLIQIIALKRHRITSYVKVGIANLINVIFASDPMCDTYREGSLWFLFRGTRGTYCPDLFIKLLDMYHQIVDEHMTVMTVEPLFFDGDDIIEMQRELGLIKSFNKQMMKLFLSSPIVFLPEFESLWIDKHTDDTDINELFIIPCTDELQFYNRYKHLDPEILSLYNQCFIFVPQRSEIWLDMIENRFVCGNNGGTIDHSTFQGRYNLIRGNVIEILAINYFNPEMHAGLKGFRAIQLGFIVEKDEIGACGFSPDLVLISDDEFILVEIKGLKSGAKNSDYYRGLHLASKQIKSGKDILGKYISQDKLKICRGIILLCYIEDGNFMMNVHHVSF